MSLSLASRRRGAIDPRRIAAAWYSMPDSTAIAGEWQTIVDLQGGSSLVQTDVDRRLASGTSGNGLAIGTYDGSDCMRMPLGANNFSTSKFGVAQWYKLSATGGTWVALYNNDAAVRVLDVYFYNSGRVDIEIFTDNVTGRVYSTATGAVSTSAYCFPRLQIDFSKSAECDTTGAIDDARVRFFSDETAKALTASNLGLGAVPSALRAPTGAAVFGGLNDADAPSSPAGNGTIHGPDTFVLLQTPSVLQGLALRDYRRVA